MIKKKNRCYSLKKINTLIKCFDEIEEFSLSKEQQRKIIVWLRDRILEKSRLSKKIKEFEDGSQF